MDKDLVEFEAWLAPIKKINLCVYDGSFWKQGAWAAWQQCKSDCRKLMMNEAMRSAEINKERQAYIKMLEEFISDCSQLLDKDVNASIGHNSVIHYKMKAIAKAGG